MRITHFIKTKGNLQQTQGKASNAHKHNKCMLIRVN